MRDLRCLLRESLPEIIGGLVAATILTILGALNKQLGWWIIILALIAFGLSVYFAFSKKESGIVGGRRIYRYPSYRRLALIGVVLIPTLVIILFVIEPTRDLVLNALIGIKTPVPPPTIVPSETKTPTATPIHTLTSTPLIVSPTPTNTPTPTSTPTPRLTPTVEVYPPSGPIGTKFLFIGSNFTPNGSLWLYLTHPEGISHDQGIIVADEDGGFSLPLVLGEPWPTGTYRYTVLDIQSVFSAITSFTITAPATPTSTATEIPMVTPTHTPTSTSTSAPTRTPISTVTQEPTSTATQVPTSTDTPRSTQTATQTSTPTSTPVVTKPTSPPIPMLPTPTPEVTRPTSTPTTELSTPTITPATTPTDIIPTPPAMPTDIIPTPPAMPTDIIPTPPPTPTPTIQL